MIKTSSRLVTSLCVRGIKILTLMPNGVIFILKATMNYKVSLNSVTYDFVTLAFHQ